MLMSIASRAFSFLTNVLSSGVRMAASPRLLGRYSGGAGAAQEIQLGAGFSFVGDTLTYTSGGGAATWGAITGTLASQSDLVAALTAKAASSHTHVSADITNAISDAVSDVGPNGKLLKVSQSGLNPSRIILGEFVASLGGEVSGAAAYYKPGGIDAKFLGATIFSASFPTNPTGGSLLFCVLRQYADSTAANAAVSIGDAWWDTTLNKARVRLS